MNKQLIEQLLLRCQKNPRFFIEQFCKVKHPKAGILPFKLFKYQTKSLHAFLEHRFNVYGKCRQSGISTLVGAFALWYGMFFPHKTILIVSKRDEDAKGFLDKNIKFVYDHLPQFFKDIYGDPPQVYNEHNIVFKNGTSIKSLTSNKETLRSNSATLVIIDEAAFMADMDAMWRGGWSTLQHGGNVIVISTPNGVGNWYHSTWEDAIAKRNDFNPINVRWWDMDWKISYKNELNGEMITIDPTYNIRQCETKEEIDKWGPFYSPWLEEQFRGLQREGKAHSFRQEILAEFIGSGSTVLSREALLHVQSTVSKKFMTVKHVAYIHPVTGQELELDFQDELWVWEKPIKPSPPTIENGRVIRAGSPGHSYTIGVDISSGEADDYSAIQVVDVTTMEQVAELYIKVEPSSLLLMVDYLGRWYNGAFVVPERTGLGLPTCQDLYNILGYTNIFRMMSPAQPNKKTKKIGFPTTHTYKPMLEKQLLDHVQPDGVTVYSSRLYQQFQVLVHLGNNRFGNVKGTGNHDDLPMAFSLALIGIREAVQADTSSLIPSKQMDVESDKVYMASSIGMDDLLIQGGMNCLTPLVMSGEDSKYVSKEAEVKKFITKLGGIPFHTSLPRMMSQRTF